MAKGMCRLFLALFLLAALVLRLSDSLWWRAAAASLSSFAAEEMWFREQKLCRETVERLDQLRSRTSMTFGQLLTVLHVWNGSRTLRIPGEAGPEDFVLWKNRLLRGNYGGFRRVSGCYGAVWDDASCFPVAGEGIVFENTWMFERTYGGVRGHEGTDLIPPQNVPGHYPILSATDGVVEKVGWLPRGGYRIGIRSPSGGYFYYAHLDSYSREFSAGERVEAGEVLGWMGDTGYGEEGTRGKFDVHLHFGVYLQTEESAEVSVNPYWLLLYLRGEYGGTASQP